MGNFCIAVVDGTGPYNDATYTQLMQHSFCSQIARQIGASAVCERVLTRVPHNERGERAADFLQDGRRKGARRLMLAGYSRGGSAAIMAAEILGQRGFRSLSTSRNVFHSAHS